MTASTNNSPNAMQKLRAPFPASETGQLPKGGTTLAYVGHAAITGRLLDVDPGWQWAPLAKTDEGLPLFDLDAQGRPVGLWIQLTVCGVTRLGYGSCPPGQFDAVKVLVGDALRNAAMRFGVALDLWVKGSPELPQEAEPEPVVPADLVALRDTVAEALKELSEDELVLYRAWCKSNNQSVVVAKLTPLQLDDVCLWLDSLAANRDRIPAGKSVAKGVGPSTSGVTDLKVPSEVV